jgi:hypothetical protein
LGHVSNPSAKWERRDAFLNERSKDFLSCQHVSPNFQVARFPRAIKSQYLSLSSDTQDVG